MKKIYVYSSNLNKVIVLFFFLAFAFTLNIFLAKETKAQDRLIGLPGVVASCPANGLNWFGGRAPSANTNGNISYTPDVACTCKQTQCRLSTATNFTGGQNTEGVTSNLQFICIDGNSTNLADAPKISADGKYDNLDVVKFRDIDYWQTVARGIRDNDQLAQRFCPEGSVLNSRSATKVTCCATDVEQIRSYCLANSTVPIVGGICKLFELQQAGTCVEADLPVDILTSEGGGAYFLDIFSADANRQVIPAGSTCRINPTDRNGVAYWYYPGYFDVLQGKNPGEGNPATFLGGNVCSDVLFSSRDLFGNQVGGTRTFFGCLPNSINGLVAFLVRLVTGLAVMITFLIILINLIQIVGNSTNPDAVAEAQKKMTSAIFTLVGILLTLTILSIFGVQIIGFGAEGIGGNLFRFFVGG